MDSAFFIGWEKSQAAAMFSQITGKDRVLGERTGLIPFLRIPVTA